MARGKQFTKEFQQNAVRLTKQPGKSVAGVARDLGLSPYTLYEWRRKWDAESEPTSSPEETLEQQNRRLRRELERTREEAAILKKLSLTSWNARRNKRERTLRVYRGTPGGI